MLAAIDSLKGPTLVIESSGGRVPRFAHNMGKALQLPAQSVALLAVMMLRGPQTAGELRLNSDRLHRFADISSVEGFLQELAARMEGALVVELPRQPGSRENRWAHVLSGEPDMEILPTADAAISDMAALREKVDQLEAEVDGLKDMISSLASTLGERD